MSATSTLKDLPASGTGIRDGEKSDIERGEVPEAIAPPVQAEQPAIPPEGGLGGWLCVVGSTIGLFCTFGFLAA